MSERKHGQATGPTWRWWLAVALLILVVHELHEFAHTLTGRLVCGAWAERDFNRWDVPGCASWWPTAAGPLLSFTLMWIGLALARTRSRQWLAIALVFAANPLARVFTVAMGGGDEMVLARMAAHVEVASPGLRLLVLALVLALATPPVIAAWHAMRDWPHRAWAMAALLPMGMLVTGVVLFLGFNRLLHAGVLDAPLLGAPALVQLVSLASLAALATCARWLFPPG